MARHASFGTMIAATALIAWPVLAQTTSGPGQHAAGVDLEPNNHHDDPASPGMATTAPTATSGAPKYFTADHQVRASKVVGASVYNDQNQSVGSIDDMLMGDRDHKAATVVISVGGFLGMGSKARLGAVRAAEDRERQDRDAGGDEGITRGHAGISLHQRVIMPGRYRL